jgi:hypothetical protein
MPTIQESLLAFSQLITSGAFADFLLVLGWLTAFVFVMAFLTWVFRLVFGSA